MSDIDRFLSDLSRSQPGFRDNPSQRAYAASIDETLSGPVGSVGFVQGDTGIGKSLAYLVAAASWLAAAPARRKRQVVVATHSRVLQQQLVGEHTQKLVAGFCRSIGHRPLSFDVRMGRQNYVDPDRAAQALGAGPDRDSLPSLIERSDVNPNIKALAEWVWRYPDGCLLDLDEHILPEGIEIKDISVLPYGDRPDTLIERNRVARAADICVINHALLVNDLMSGQDLAGEGVEVALIIDEGEHFPGMAEQMLQNGLSFGEVSRTAGRLGYHRLAERWGEVADRFTRPTLADRAVRMTPDEQEAIASALLVLSQSRKGNPDESADAYLWQLYREQASQLRAGMHRSPESVFISHSPIKGVPRMLSNVDGAGRIIHRGIENRWTIFTSATLSDMGSDSMHAQFMYMRTSLRLPKADPRVRVERSHEATDFGRLTFKVAASSHRPLVEDEDGTYRLNEHYAREVMREITAPIDGRTLVLCSSYADQAVLSSLAPASLMSRLTIPRAGQNLNTIAAGMSRDGVLVTPAGWEGLSPARHNEPFWRRIVLVRNPQAPVTASALYSRTQNLREYRGLSLAQAESAARASLMTEIVVDAIHRIRQGLGRAIRHPDDSCEIVICDPRFVSKNSDPLALGGLERAIPPRFRLAYREARSSNAADEAEALIL